MFKTYCDIGEVLTRVEHMVNASVDEFADPEDAIWPLLICFAESGISVRRLDPMLFGSREGQEILAQTIIPFHLERLEPEIFGLIVPSTALRQDTEESVIIQISDSDHTQVSVASVHRSSERPPRLGRWSKRSEPVLSGRFLEPLQAMVRR